MFEVIVLEGEDAKKFMEYDKTPLTEDEIKALEEDYNFYLEHIDE